MRQARPTTSLADAPLVGLFVPTELGFGRRHVAGFMRYVHAVSRWRMIARYQFAVSEVECLEGLAGLAISCPEPGMMRPAAGLPFPVVNLSARALGTLPSVCVDDEAMGRLAGEYLRQRGFDRFAYWCDRVDESTRARRRGFVEAVAGGDGAAVVDLECGAQEGGAAWGRLREQLRGLPKPAAVFCYSDLLGRLLAQCCAEAGVLVPEQLAIVGCDNDELVCRTSHPPLSSVDSRCEAVGYEAAALLDRLIAGERAPREPIRVPPGDVVERRSSEIFAVEDRRLAMALAYMHEHACEPAHVVDVAKDLKIPRRWIERAFARELGTTPHTYLNQLRLDRARRLLRDTNLSVPAVAEQSGFGHEPNLRRAFRRRYQQTPAQYRRGLSSTENAG